MKEKLSLIADIKKMFMNLLRISLILKYANEQNKLSLIEEENLKVSLMF